jgi:glycosyltransferase involved in cell wall biosynthesis
MLLRADACVTYGMTTTWYFRHIGIAPEAIFVAPNTVDLARIEVDRAAWASRSHELEALRQRLDLHGRRVVLHVGSLQHNKPLDPLLRACAAIERRGTPVALIIVGDGRGRRRVESLSREVGLQRVHLPGRLTEGLGGLALLADVAMFPHGSTLGILTALGYGLPVIAGVGRSPEHEAIEPGFNGILVPAGNVDALADALQAILKKRLDFASPDEIRRHVHSNFSLDRMVNALEGAIRWAVGQRDRVARPITDHVRDIR